MEGKTTAASRLIAVGLHRLHHLVGQVFDKDQGTNKDIGLGHILLERVVVFLTAQLLDQVAADFEGHFGVVGVDGANSRGQSTLVLRLQNHIDHLDQRSPVQILGGDVPKRVAHSGLDVGEHAVMTPFPKPLLSGELQFL
jgi:hypothetical protein